MCFHAFDSTIDQTMPSFDEFFVCHCISWATLLHQYILFKWRIRGKCQRTLQGIVFEPSTYWLALHIGHTSKSLFSLQYKMHPCSHAWIDV
jgi:hypothetical protein